MAGPDLDQQPSPFETEADRPSRKGLGTILLGLVVALSFLPWAWRWSPWADRTADGLLDDATFAVVGESICAQTVTDLEALPNALDAADNVERAAQIRQANALLEAMVDDLETEITGSARDVENLTEWIADWRQYLVNRADYAERFALDGNEVFYVDAVGIERLDRRIPRFARANSMPSCITPSDIG